MHASTSRCRRARILALAATLTPAAVVLAGAPGVSAQAAAGPSLQSSTYHGGLQWDEAFDVDIDAAGNRYVAGFTVSDDLPTRNARQARFGGVVDGFVVKYGPAGRLLWSSYIGGSKVDVVTSIAVDDVGNAYVTGRTESPDFPVKAAFQPRLRGNGCQGTPCHDAFVTKIDPAGRLVYSTFIGGTSNEDGVGIAVDTAGAAYISGNTDSFDFPTKHAFQDTFQTPPCTGDFPCSPDNFVAKLAPSGRTLVYGTYLGGSESDTNGGIAVDADGRALVVGSTRSTDFPIRQPLQARIRGRACGPPPGEPCRDVFVTKLSVGGGTAVFSTYLGGRKDEASGGIAVDAGGNVYVTGRTASPDYPTRRAAQGALANESCDAAVPVEEVCDDAFVSKLEPRGRALVYSTYLGGNATDQGLGIAVTDTGAAVVTGRTDSLHFPTRQAVQSRFGGVSDAFVTRFTVAGRIAYSTYLGGSDSERSNGVALDDTGRATVTGRTLSPDLRTRRASQPALAGDYDAFISNIR
jgi:hypothetical protein